LFRRKQEEPLIYTVNWQRIGHCAATPHPTKGRFRTAQGQSPSGVPSETVTTGNLLLSILNMLNVQQESIGDSTGDLTGLYDAGHKNQSWVRFAVGSFGTGSQPLRKLLS